MFSRGIISELKRKILSDTLLMLKHKNFVNDLPSLSTVINWSPQERWMNGIGKIAGTN